MMSKKRIAQGKFWDDLTWLRKVGFIVKNIRLLTISFGYGKFGDLINEFIRVEKRFNPDWRVCLTVLFVALKNVGIWSFPCPEHIIGELFDFECKYDKRICVKAFNMINTVMMMILGWEEDLGFESKENYNFLVSALYDTAGRLLRKNLLHRYK